MGIWKKEKLPLILIPFLVIALNIFQVSHTELTTDEARHWVWTQYLSLGYVQHPPFVAYFVWPGMKLFQNELGVRLFFILAHGFLLFLGLVLLDGKKPLLFLLLYFSSFLFQISGLIALPQGPLAFFMGPFFLFYRIYLDKEGVGIACALGAAAALMVLSHYLGFLTIFFSFLARPNLLRRKSFLATIMVFLLVLSPHIVWLLQNQLVTVKYPLTKWENVPFDSFSVLKYLLYQLVITNPAVGPVLFFLAIRRTCKNDFEKMLKYNVLGYFLFFLLLSFLGKIKAHWPAPELFPLLLLGHLALSEKSHLIPRLLPLMLVGMVLAFPVRRDIYGFFGKLTNMDYEEKGFRQWAEGLKREAGDRPVIFLNTGPERAYMYSFYAGGLPHYFRDNLENEDQINDQQYDLWNIEEKIQGQSVCLYKLPRPWSKGDNQKEPALDCKDRFYTFHKVSVEWSFKNPGEMEILIKNNLPVTLDFGFNKNNPTYLVSLISQGKDMATHHLKKLEGTLPGGGSLKLKVPFQAPVSPGLYRIGVSMETQGVLFWFKKNLREIQVRQLAPGERLQRF